ncbi:ABC transporter permease [Butyrivibrio sp. AC2005]|uniref:ABC transporter permease n=1 Tax=Butyrivibrio sp. AC2005 TaxID=1280672 RepID=UPI000422CD93|nr:ABC transporter permease subunit [Butyrivibrio sp. AC2005]
MGTKKQKINWKHWMPFYLMFLPGAAYLLINNYIPLYGLQLAFKSFSYKKGIGGSKWIGFKNFKFLFSTSDAFIMIRNTLLYNILWIFIGMIFGITVAILFNEVKNAVAKKIYQTAILLPYLMSMVVVAYLVYAYLAGDTGLVNNAIVKGIFGKSDGVQWYGDQKYWPFILTFVQQWKQIGFGMLLYLASLLGIDNSYYEAAMLDGATKWQQIKLITLPLLKPTIIMLVILNLGQIFRSDFGLFYQVPMNQGALFGTTQTIDTYVYRALLENNNVGMSAAASFLQSIVGFIFIITANAIVRRLDENSSLF